MADPLANDDVKYVSYAIVFTKPGRERVMPFGEGSMVLTESLTDTQFIAMVIAKYVQENMRKPQYADIIREPSDSKYLKVYFVNPATWAREPLFKEDRQTRALERLSDGLVDRRRG